MGNPTEEMNERMNGIELEVDQLQMADPTNHTDLADLANPTNHGIELEVDQLQMADPTNHTDLADLANPTNLAHLADPAHPAHPLRALAADSTLSSAVSAREQRLAQRRREREARRPESSMGETPPPSLCSHSLPSTSCNSYCPSRIQTGNEPEVFSPEQLQVRSRRTPTPPP